MGTKNATKKQAITVKDLPAETGKDVKGGTPRGNYVEEVSSGSKPIEAVGT